MLDLIQAIDSETKIGSLKGQTSSHEEIGKQRGETTPSKGLAKVWGSRNSFLSEDGQSYEEGESSGKSRAKRTVSNNYWSKYLQAERSIATEIFYGLMEVSIVCLECKHQSS